MTLGDLRIRILKIFPSLDLDVLDGFIGDRYSEIIEELPWTRLNGRGVIQTIAPYSTGTVAMTQGGNAVTLTGGLWTAAMTGRWLRVAGDDDFYGFTQTGDSTGTLDRNYEGAASAAAAYTIFQHIYPVASNCRILADDAFATFSYGPLDRLTRGQLNLSDPARGEVGIPASWASYMDDSATPPDMQVEFYPVPDAAYNIPYSFTAEASAPTSGGVAFLPWITPATALVEGVMAKLYRTPQFKDVQLAALASADAKAALSTMRNNAAQRLPQTRMQLSSHFTSHRARRWQSASEDNEPPSTTPAS
jgi:hypothetical protein